MSLPDPSPPRGEQPEKADKELSLDEALNVLRYQLDVERLRLDESSARLEGTFFAKHFPALLAAAIALAGIVVSAANIFVGHLTNKSNAELSAKKDLREFVATHRTELFGTDRATAEQLRRTLEVTFPAPLVTEVLEKIAPKAPAETRDIFNVAPKTGSTIRGRIGMWGGPNDSSVAPSEGLALINPQEWPQFQEYLLPNQPEGTSGLARRLDPKSSYISARWDLTRFPRRFLQTHKVTVTNPRDGKTAEAQPVDWGPDAKSGRVADISPGLAQKLGLSIGDEAIIQIPEP
jgi:hypothetical protein